LFHFSYIVVYSTLKLFFSASQHFHIVPRPHSLQWLQVQIAFRLAVLIYCCIHGRAPNYLSADLLHVSNVGLRQRLCSAMTSALVGRCSQRTTIGDLAFAAATAAVWNSLPEDVQSFPLLPLFWCRLKSEPFRHFLGPRHSTRLITVM